MRVENENFIENYQDRHNAMQKRSVIISSTSFDLTTESSCNWDHRLFLYYETWTSPCTNQAQSSTCTSKMENVCQWLFCHDLRVRRRCSERANMKNKNLSPKPRRHTSTTCTTKKLRKVKKYSLLYAVDLWARALSRNMRRRWSNTISSYRSSSAAASLIGCRALSVTLTQAASESRNLPHRSGVRWTSQQCRDSREMISLSSVCSALMWWTWTRTTAEASTGAFMRGEFSMSIWELFLVGFWRWSE